MYLPVIKPIIRTILRILSFILFGITILSAFGGRVDPDFVTTPAVLVLAFPYLAVASIIVTIAWLAVGRWITGALGLFALFCVWSQFNNVSPIKFPKDPDPDKNTFSLMSWNFLHGDDLENGNDYPSNKAINYIIESGADIVCLQEYCNFDNPNEIHNFTPQLKDSLLKAYPYQAGTSQNDQKVFSKYPVKLLPYDKCFNEPEADRTRYSFYQVNINGKNLVIANIHISSPKLSTEERSIVRQATTVDGAKKSVDEFKGSIREKLKIAFSTRKKDVAYLRKAIDNYTAPIIICGDLNDVPESYAYRLLRGDDIRDAYVDTSFGPMVTYNLHAFWFHLDHILYRGDIKALSIKKGPIKTSDHYPLIAEFQFEN